MKYSIKLNAVNNPDKNVKAFATVTFGDCFKITNIAVVKSQEAEPFVSMPSFKSKEIIVQKYSFLMKSNGHKEVLQESWRLDQGQVP